MGEMLFSEEGLWIYKMKTRDIPLFSAFEQTAAEQGFVIHQSDAVHASQMDDPDLFYAMLMDEQRDEPVGYALLAGLLTKPPMIELRRLVIFRPSQGYGRRAVKLMKAFAFTSLSAHRLWLDVRSHNEVAYSLYKSEGFLDEGTLREAVFWKNQFLNVRILSILKSD